MGNIIKKMRDLNDYISFVVISAPNNFPKAGPFSENVQANLIHAFDEIYSGVTLLEKKFKVTQDLSQLKNLLKNSNRAYLEGNSIEGAHLLQDFQDIVFPNRLIDYKATQ